MDKNYSQTMLGRIIDVSMQDVDITEREIKILNDRFESKTYKEIGLELGVTTERIRQIEARSFRRVIRNLEKLKEENRALIGLQKKFSILNGIFGVIKRELNNIENIETLARIPVSTYDLSIRDSNCLQNEDINYLDEIEYKSESDMLRIPNYGRKSLNELKELMSKHNLVIGSKKHLNN